MSSVSSRLIHGDRTGRHPNECGLFRSCLKDAAADPNMFQAVNQQGSMSERVFGARSEKTAAKAKLQTLCSQLLAQLESIPSTVAGTSAQQHTENSHHKKE